MSNTPSPDPLSDPAAAWALAMRAQGLSERTIAERARLLAQIHHETGARPQDLTAEQVTAWLAGLQASPATRAAYHAIIRAWGAWLAATGHRDTNPAAAVPRPRTPPASPRPITDDQLATILAQPLRAPTRAKIILAAYAGMRIHEIARIKGSHIDHAAGTITITGKGGRTDTLPAHPLVLDLAHAPGRPQGYWFPSPADPTRCVTARAVGATIAAAMRRAGVAATAHQLRHRFATSLLASGADVRVIQTLMRHESLATTARYIAITTDQQRAALDNLT